MFKLFLKTSAYFLHPILNKFFEFNGRATKKEFFFFQLWYFISSLMMVSFCFILALMLSVKFGMEKTKVLDIVILINYFFHFIIFLPNFTLSVRRCHDFGKSFWFSLLQFIPLLNIIIYLMFFFKNSEPINNKFGQYRKFS